MSLRKKLDSEPRDRIRLFLERERSQLGGLLPSQWLEQIGEVDVRVFNRLRTNMIPGSAAYLEAANDIDIDI